MILKKNDLAIPVLKTFVLRISREKGRVLSDWAWTALGQLAAAAGFLAGMRLMTQYVRPDVFGTVSLLLGTATLLTATFCAPFIEAALRFYPDAARDGQVPLLREVTNSFLIRSAKALSPVVGAAGLLLFFLYREKTAFLMAMASLCGLLVVDAVKAKERNFLNAGRRQKAMAVWLATDTWARFLGAIIMVLVFGSSTGSVLSGYLAGSLLLLAFFYFRKGSGLARAVAPSTMEEKKANLPDEIRRYAIPIIPMAIVGWIASLGDRYIISALSGLEQVGIYSASYGLVSRPFLMAGGVIEQTLRPLYFEAVSAGDKAREKKTFFALLSATVLASLCLVAVITLMRREIAGLLLERRYSAGADLIPWIALGYAFLVVSYVFEKICYAYKKTKSVFFAQSAGAAASLGAGIPMICHYGLLGASMAVPVYFGIQLAVSAVMARQALKGAG